MAYKWIYERSYISLYLNCGEWFEDMIAVIHTTYAVVKLNPEKKIQAWMGLEPMTSAESVQYSANWAIKPIGSCMVVDGEEKPFKAVFIF